MPGTWLGPSAPGRLLLAGGADLRGQLLQAPYALCMQLEQGLATGQADVKAALGSIAAKAGALPACQQEYRSLALHVHAACVACK